MLDPASTDKAFPLIFTANAYDNALSPGAYNMIDATVSPGVNTAFKLSEFAIHVYEAPQESQAFVRSICRVRSDLEECQRLFHITSISQHIRIKEPEKCNRVEDVVRDCYVSLNEIGLYVERVGDGMKWESSVGFLKRVRVVLNDREKLANLRSDLALCHQSLSTVLTELHGLQRLLVDHMDRPTSKANKGENPGPRLESERDVPPMLPSYQEAARQKDEYWTPNSRRNRHSTARHRTRSRGSSISEVSTMEYSDHMKAGSTESPSKKLPWPLNDSNAAGSAMEPGVVAYPLIYEQANMCGGEMKTAQRDGTSGQRNWHNQTRPSVLAQSTLSGQQLSSQVPRKLPSRIKSRHLSSNVKYPIDPFELWTESGNSAIEAGEERHSDQSCWSPGSNATELDSFQRQIQSASAPHQVPGKASYQAHNTGIAEIDGRAISPKQLRRKPVAASSVKSPESESSPPVPIAYVSRPQSTRSTPAQRESGTSINTDDIPAILRPAHGRVHRSHSDVHGELESIHRQRVNSCPVPENIRPKGELGIAEGEIPHKTVARVNSDVQTQSRDAARRQRRRAAMDAALGL